MIDGPDVDGQMIAGQSIERVKMRERKWKEQIGRMGLEGEWKDGSQ